MFPAGTEIRGLARGQLGAFQAKVGDRETLLAEQFGHVRTHDQAQPCQQGCIEGIGFCHLAHGLGEAPGHQRTDHRHLETGGVQAQVQFLVIAAGRFDNDKLDISLVRCQSRILSTGCLRQRLPAVRNRGRTRVDSAWKPNS